MAPIRIGFIGLSAKGSWAAGAHLPYLASTSRYAITALCNSSTDAARASIAAHSLPSTTKVYASPAELAADKDIDLVVVSVRVDKHYDAMVPVLKAGKDCFVEWPLASTHAQAEELVELAKQSSSRVMVGLQNQQVPAVQKLKQLIASDRLGRLLSVRVVANAMSLGGPSLPKGFEYTATIPVGGTMINIAGGHLFDTVLVAAGAELASLNATMTVQHPQIDILDENGKIVDTIERTAHDYISLQGQLTNGAAFSASLGGGMPYKGKPMLTLRFEGEKAEAVITSPYFMSISDGEVLTVQDKDADEAEVIETPQPLAALKDLPRIASAVGNLYEAFADGDQDAYPDAEWALKRHAMIQAMYDSNENGERKSYISA